MSANRCPHCDLPLTRSERKSGKCPSCSKSLNHADFGEGEAEAIQTPPRKPLGFLALFAILFVGGFASAILTAAIDDFKHIGTAPAVVPGVMATYFILYSMGLIKKREKTA